MKRIKKNNLRKRLRKNRVRARLFGTAIQPRASVFRSNKFLYVQLIDDQKGQTIFSSFSKKGIKEATGLGGKIAQLLNKAGVKSVILDRGSYRYHGQVRALAEGIKNNGIKI